MRRLLYVAFFLEVGLLLIVLPWSSFWEHNYFALLSPPVHLVILNNFVRGAVSGLGVANLLAGFGELAGVFDFRDVSHHPMADPGAVDAPGFPSGPDA